jgi:GT2 family glycosyltransferase
MSALDKLLIVDNGRLGASRRAAEEAGACYLHEPRPGVAFARNCGTTHARHETVVFLDDDGMADRSLIEALVAPLVADPAVVATVGGVLGRDPASAVGQLFDERYPLFRGWAERRFAGGTGTAMSPFDVWQVGPGAAMAWRRSVLTELGGFDPALGEGTPAGGAEDSDLFRRALERGHTIVYTPHALLWHDHPATRTELRRKMNHYAVASAGHATKITIETRRLGAAKLVIRQLGWLPGWVSTEAGQRLRGHRALPLAGIVPFPLMTVLGVARFLRHRERLRALDGGPSASGIS